MIFELDSKAAYNLLEEINKIKQWCSLENYTFNKTFSNLRELRMSLRTQLSGLIDENDEWIEYTNLYDIKQELYETEKRMKNYDRDNPFQRGLPYKLGNLTKLFQQRCPHTKKSYSSLRGSPYRTLYCEDCKAELGPMEYKPSFLKNNNIDLSVFDDKKDTK